MRQPRQVLPSTVWFWLVVTVPFVPILLWTAMVFPPVAEPLANWFGTDPKNLGVWYLLVGQLSLALIALAIPFAALDMRALSRRGIVRPFHWVYAILILASPFVPLLAHGVYVIGRTVVVRRQTGAGMAPFWVWLGLAILVSVPILLLTLAVYAGLVVLG